MTNLQAQRVMGLSGLLMGLAVLLTIPLYCFGSLVKATCFSTRLSVSCEHEAASR